MENVQPTVEEGAAQEEVATPGLGPLTEATPATVQVLDQPSAKACDFPEPSLLSESQMRKLRLRHEDFVRCLATRLSIYFRVEFGVQFMELQTRPYPRFIHSLPASTHLTLFKLEGLTGIGLVEVSPQFGLALVERMLGGAGTPVTAARQLTELEVSILDHAILLVLKEWLPAVLGLPEAKIDLFGHESNPRFLKLASEETSMLILSLHATLGESVETIRLACPFPMVEPVFRELETTPAAPAVTSPPTALPALDWNPRLDEVKVPVSACWNGIQIKAETLARLQPGDVLPLNGDLFNQVQIRLAKLTKFVGRLGQCNDHWAIELHGPVKTHL